MNSVAMARPRCLKSSSASAVVPDALGQVGRGEAVGQHALVRLPRKGVDGHTHADVRFVGVVERQFAVLDQHAGFLGPG